MMKRSNINNIVSSIKVIAQDPRRKTNVPVPDNPEHVPHRRREEPLKPEPDMPEHSPQRKREEPVKPNPQIPERDPHKTPTPKRIS
ncbi:MAG: hypothetical protein DWQ44_00685 [Bacteroidetes bacterium]|nr:MAG: hypothetical protein DWQ33_04060 [Bacteroidota bacterium]REK07540.1 MAG: hypothetical protein DWQ39_01210 [Bacteroidota bacterium]REK37027.1 MAG: hypothetical protein DWQ44_00685 [Bacteroidota bacterium]REK47849.1 MAG: hypothetical protein DWQ48_11750 [Bacteroidota bacterium]